MTDDSLEPERHACTRWAALRWAVAILLGLIPLFVVVWEVVHHGFAFPYWDEWLMAPVITKSLEGELSFADLWAQHNEHRLFFPRVILVVLARITRWDVRFELGANVLVALGTLAGLMWLSLRDARTLGRRVSVWLLPAFSFFVFSWAQMENWISGFQIQVFLNALAVVVGVVILSRAKAPWWNLAGGIFAGLVATFSMANGLLYWFAAFPVVITRPDHTRRMRMLQAEVWAVAAFLTFEAYLYGYAKPDESPALTAGLHNPAACLGYFLLYIGGPLTGLVTQPMWHGLTGPVRWEQFIPGVMGLVALVALSGLTLRRGGGWGRIVPWWSLALYAIGSGLLTSLGRVGFGLGQALTSTYMTTALLFWCAIVGVVFLWSPVRIRSAYAWIGAAILASAVVILGQYAFVRQNQFWEEVARWKRMAWQGILAGDEERLYLQHLCWNPEALQKLYLPLLKKHGLCGLAPDIRPDPGKAPMFFEEAQRYVQMKEWPAAAAYLRTTLHVDPSHAAAKALLQEVSEKAANFPKNSP